jgi:hypothetical protein
VRIILNSDILYTQKLLTNLPQRLQKLATECARLGAILVLPRTALFEVDRQQQENMKKEITAVEGACNTLRNAGLAFEERELSELFVLPDIGELFRGTGVKVEVPEPSLDDFNDAHRRACFHLSPHPPDIKSDEMRDLVIWVMALRLAKDGGAILLSRDTVHTHERGDDEASSVGLLRVKNIDDALDLLAVESPTGRFVRLLLEPIWDDLRKAGLPLVQGFSLRKIENAVFVQGEFGLERATFNLETGAENGGTLRAEVDIRRTEDEIRSVSLSDVSIDGQAWETGALTIHLNKSVPMPSSDLDEPLGELRETIGEQL